MHRRGMELAVNTLVVLILGIVIVGGGLALINSIYHKAVKLPDQVSQQTQEQLFSMLLNGDQRIAVLNNVQKVKRGKTATFPIAIQNDLEGTEATFKVKDMTKIGGPDCTVGTDCPTGIYLKNEMTIKRYNHKAFYVGVQVPKSAKSGEYVFMVNVNTIPDSGGSPPSLYARTKVNVIVE